MKKKENLADSPLLRPLIERRWQAEQTPSLTDEELTLIFNASRSLPSTPPHLPALHRRTLWPRVAALLTLFLLGAAVLIPLLTPSTTAPAGPALAQVAPAPATATLPCPPPVSAAAKPSPHPVRHNPEPVQPLTPATPDSLSEAEFFLALESLPGSSDDLGIDLAPPPSYSIEGLQYDHFICSSDVCDTLLFFYQVHIDLIV